MKTKLMYVADDGTSFDTEKECIDYEKSMNKYVVLYDDKESYLTVRETFNDEPSAKRFISNRLHEFYEDNITGKFKLIHCGKTVEFNSDELSKFVPAHYNIDGNKLNKVFQMSTTKNVKIEGYTLHGDYYLADKVVIDVDWIEAREMKQTVTLPNGKTVVAHTLSKKELESIPKNERGTDNDWYWTSTPDDDSHAWYVNSHGDFSSLYILYSIYYGGVRLGFKNPFIN